MAIDGNKTLADEPQSSSSFSSDGWKERILVSTILAGVAGGGFGLVSRHWKVHGLANISATYATNFAIVAGCYCGAREFVRASRKSTHDGLLNSAIAGFGSGAILGRLQAGQMGAIRYSVIFAVVGITVDYASLKFKPALENYRKVSSEKSSSWLKVPEWSPIKVLDEEALAAKKDREEKLLCSNTSNQRRGLRSLKNDGCFELVGIKLGLADWFGF